VNAFSKPTGTNTFTLKRENLLPLDFERVRSLKLSPEAEAELREEVEAALATEALSVVRNKRLAPSGNPHDYVSLAPYFWPDPESEDGLPWVMRDGELNPERDEGDNMPLFELCIVLRLLCLGHVLLEDERCLAQIEQRLQHWFLDPERYMTPHLAYAQYVPGLADGHCWGLIDTSLLPGMLDALLLVEADLDPVLMQGLRDWVSAYADWFLHSDLGVEEAAMHNNHASWHLTQALAYLNFAGEPDAARELLQQRVARLIFDHIQADGAQPHELERSLSFMYSSYNLVAHCCSAIYAERMGQSLPADLLERLEAAACFLLPAAGGETPWPYEQIKPMDSSPLIAVLAWLSPFTTTPQLRVQAAALCEQGGWRQSYRRELLGL